MSHHYDCPDCGGELRKDRRDPAYGVLVLACTYCKARVTEKAAGWPA